MIVLDDNNSYVEPTYLMVTLAVVTTWCNQIGASRWCSWSFGELMMIPCLWWWCGGAQMMEMDDAILGDGFEPLHFMVEPMVQLIIWWLLDRDDMVVLLWWLVQLRWWCTWWWHMVQLVTWWCRWHDLMIALMMALMPWCRWHDDVIVLVTWYIHSGEGLMSFGHDDIHDVTWCSCLWWGSLTLPKLIQPYQPLQSPHTPFLFPSTTP